MPYVKINKHVENAKVMYHTHPSKDEPSFTSADDINGTLMLRINGTSDTSTQLWLTA